MRVELVLNPAICQLVSLTGDFAQGFALQRAEIGFLKQQSNHKSYPEALVRQMLLAHRIVNRPGQCPGKLTYQTYSNRPYRQSPIS